jgi:excisionase family DNA binding protein
MTTNEQLREPTLTAAEIAKLLGVNIDTVRRWLASGQLKGWRFGKRSGWRVYEHDLRDFIEQRSNVPAAS